MGTRSYENFDLLIEADSAGQYRARVTHCPVGDTPASVFTLPFSPTELENLLLRLDPGRSGMRRIADPHTKASMDLGSGLFDAVFRDEVLVAWSRSKDAVRQDGRGLRLRLRLTGAPSLAAMPWELLYDKSSRMFYAQSDRTPVVRYLDVTNPPRPLTVRGPLRILAVIASPDGWPRLDVEREWATICDALADKQSDRLVSVDRLPAPTIGEMQRWLRHNEVHVLHFVGHGYFDDRLEDGMLMFTDPGGRAVPVSSAVLGAHVRDHDPLRLVVLNACQTARVDDADPYSGMAQGLIQQEAAAVVAMQFPISDNAAIVFTREFYGAVADGEPLDQAMASARKALLAEHTAEWATPVLFLRAPDGRVFDRAEDPKPPVASPLPSASPEPRPTPGPIIQPVPIASVTDAHSPSLPDQDRPQSPVLPSILPVSESRWYTSAPSPPVRPPTSPTGPAGPGPRRRHRAGYWIAAAVVAVIVVISAVIYLGHSHQSSGNQASGNRSSGNQSPGNQSPGNQSSGPSATGQTSTSPDAVVTAFYNAINQKDWPQLWRILGNTGQPTTTDLAQMKQGFAKTSKDDFTITSTNGNDVTVLLVAAEVDGTAQIYHTSYTVSGGVIVHSSSSRIVDVPLGPSNFSTVSGKWLRKDRTLNITPEGLGIAKFRVFRSCTSNPSPCDSVSGNRIYPGGMTVFQLTGENGNQAQGYVVDSSVPGSSSGQAAVTFQPSNDSVALTTAGQNTPVTYCGPQAPAGLCGS
jgi:CHAT domain